MEKKPQKSHTRLFRNSHVFYSILFTLLTKQEKYWPKTNKIRKSGSARAQS